MSTYREGDTVILIDGGVGHNPEWSTNGGLAWTHFPPGTVAVVTGVWTIRGTTEYEVTARHATCVRLAGELRPVRNG